MTDDQIKHMVDKFLAYRFPEDIQPDGGLSIRRVFNEGTPHEFRATPSGTNLLNAAQATDMVRHMIEGLPALPPQGDGWQDIASAPRDRTVIWLGSATEQRRELGWWGGVQWNSQPLGTRIQFDVTHWRPLPAPPAAEIERTKGGG